MECYLAIKISGLLNHTHTQKKLKCTLVRERVNLEKARYCMILTTGRLEKGKTMQTV